MIGRAELGSDGDSFREDATSAFKEVKNWSKKGRKERVTWPAMGERDPAVRGRHGVRNVGEVQGRPVTSRSALEDLMCSLRRSQ